MLRTARTSGVGLFEQLEGEGSGNGSGATDEMAVEADGRK
jgi:hypothetical protein